MLASHPLREEEGGPQHGDGPATVLREGGSMIFHRSDWHQADSFRDVANETPEAGGPTNSRTSGVPTTHRAERVTASRTPTLDPKVASKSRTDSIVQGENLTAAPTTTVASKVIVTVTTTPVATSWPRREHFVLFTTMDPPPLPHKTSSTAEATTLVSTTILASMKDVRPNASTRAPKIPASDESKTLSLPVLQPETASVKIDHKASTLASTQASHALAANFTSTTVL